MPRPLGERLPTLDILRGFALMGILIMNMPGFGELPFAKADGSHLWPGAIDQAAEQLRDLLFSGKFKSMFSLLFGLGLTIQFQRMLDLDPAGAPAMGLAHASLLWTGDVLHLYALLGTVLPLMLLLGLRWVSDRGIVWLIGACLSIRWPPAWCGWRWSAPSSRRGRVKEAQALEASNNLANGQGIYSHTVLENPRVMAYDCLDLWSLWVTFGGAVSAWLFVLGLYWIAPVIIVTQRVEIAARQGSTDLRRAANISKQIYGREELAQLVEMLVRLREVAEGLPDLPRVMPDLG